MIVPFIARNRVSDKSSTLPATISIVTIVARRSFSPGEEVNAQHKIVSTSVAQGSQKSNPRMGKAGCSQKITTTLTINSSGLRKWRVLS